jgi:hypothetical protein
LTDENLEAACAVVHDATPAGWFVGRSTGWAITIRTLVVYIACVLLLSLALPVAVGRFLGIKPTEALGALIVVPCVAGIIGRRSRRSEGRSGVADVVPRPEARGAMGSLVAIPESESDEGLDRSATITSS